MVEDDIVYMRTTEGLQRVDVIYRRIDDDYPRSAGVPPRHRCSACPDCSAPTRPATSRSPTRSAPASPTTRRSTATCRRSIRFYLGEEPILQQRADLALPRARTSRLRARQPRRAGGEGGARLRRLRHADRAEGRKGQIAAFRAKLKSDPRNFIAQPTLALSTCPTCVEDGIAPRHVDLRPFVLSGRDRCASCPAASPASR